MGQPLSMNLRSRLLAAVDDGMSCRAAAVQFDVAASTAIRWHAQLLAVGGLRDQSVVSTKSGLSRSYPALRCR